MTPFLVLARRELRADVKRGFRGFRIFLACLALGVATIAAAGELTVAVQAGIDADSRSLLGGDITISQSYHALDADVRLWLEDRGKLTQRAEMRAMVKAANGERSLVELKAVDGAYPLYGELRTEPQDIDLSASHEGAFPALADPGLIERLQVKQGDIVELGTARLRVAGAILAEPDKVASPFLLGPRLMISHQALEASGLLMPGSIVRHIAGVALHPDRGAIATMKELEQRFKGAVWRIRSFDEAAPGLKRFLDNLS
ncbi:MAG: ABC transporter permease, partial [Rhodospirillales bacterium]